MKVMDLIVKFFFFKKKCALANNSDTMNKFITIKKIKRIEKKISTRGDKYCRSNCNKRGFRNFMNTIESLGNSGVN
jgi:hypothetical protein